MAFNYYHLVTLKNIWKMCFGAKLHSTYVTGLCLYPFGMPEVWTIMWWTPWGWCLMCQNVLE